MSFNFLQFGTLSIAPVDALKVIGAGLAIIVAGGFVVAYVAPVLAAVIIGILLAGVSCFVMLVATSRSFQHGTFGALLGISVDGGYAKVTDQTPVTIANALIGLAENIITAIASIGSSAGVAIAAVTPIGVWCYILSGALFMALSFALLPNSKPTP